MEQPPADQPPPDIPVAPPKLNLRRLWVSLLLPMALTAIFMTLLVLTASGKQEELFLNIGMLIVGMTGIFCWVVFSTCISHRFAGPSRILLILAFPIIQIVLVFGAFFVGCLALLQKSGLH